MKLATSFTGTRGVRYPSPDVARGFMLLFIALAVWLVTVGLCAFLERGGHAGPFETLLRTAVARSERRRRLPAPPAPASPVGASDTYDLVR